MTFYPLSQVWKAEADDLTGHQGTTRLVAVKTVKEGASEREKEDLVRELEIMQQLGSHPNVVTLLGCCTEQGNFADFNLISIISSETRIVDRYDQFSFSETIKS